MGNSNTRQLGQFFTKNADVQRVMCDLVTTRSGEALEPSAGEGHLAAALHKALPNLKMTCVELDKSVKWEHDELALVREDFFRWSKTQHAQYDVILGNPPYVAWKETLSTTKKHAHDVASCYSGKVNLYQLFFDRCIDLLAPGGEMVLIIPGEWVFSTAAAPLRAKISKLGAVTDFIHCGEEKLFSDAAVPFLCIVRFVKGATQQDLRWWPSFEKASLATKPEKRVLLTRDSRWLILPKKTAAQINTWGRLSDQFDVRVGLVSGADDVFRLADPSSVEPECVTKQVTSDRKLVNFVFADSYSALRDVPPLTRKLLRSHKSRLESRRIRVFNKNNWWHYGAVRNLAHMESSTPRFFAMVKTRHSKPFFKVAKAKYFNGGVLGIFRKPSATISIDAAVKLLNSDKYRVVLQGMLLVSGDKLTLQPSTLLDAPFPSSITEMENFLK